MERVLGVGTAKSWLFMIIVFCVCSISTVLILIVYRLFLFSKPYELDGTPKWLFFMLYIVQPIILSLTVRKAYKVGSIIAICGIAVSATLFLITRLNEHYHPTNCPAPSWQWECNIDVYDVNYLFGYTLAAFAGALLIHCAMLIFIKKRS